MMWPGNAKPAAAAPPAPPAAATEVPGSDSRQGATVQQQEQPSGYVRSRTHDPRTVAFFAEGQSSSGYEEAKPPLRKSFSNSNLTKQVQAGTAAAAAAAKSCYTSGSGTTAARSTTAAAALSSRRSLDMPNGGFARARASLELFMPMRRSASTAGAPAVAAAGAQQGDAGDSAGSNVNRRDSAEASSSQDLGVMAECFKIVPGAPGDSDAAESITMIKYTALRQQVGAFAFNLATFTSMNNSVISLNVTTCH
jgi:hypothetical protein